MLSTFTLLFNQSPELIFHNSSSIPIKQSPIHTSSHPLAIRFLLSMIWLLLGPIYVEQYLSFCEWFISFSKMINPVCSMCQNFLPLQWWIIFHSMYTWFINHLLLTFSSTHGYLHWFHLLTIMNNAVIKQVYEYLFKTLDSSYTNVVR